MDIWKYGTKIKTKSCNIEGYITGITIRELGTAYEISYFHEGKQQQAWVTECEFDVVDESVKKSIGFN